MWILDLLYPIRVALNGRVALYYFVFLTSLVLFLAMPVLGAIADYTEAVRDMERQLLANEAWVHRPKPVVDEPALVEAVRG